MRPRIAAIAAAAAAAALSNSCWYLAQGSAFLGERLSARPLSRLAAEPGADPRLAEFAALVEDVKAFAREELGLKATGHYRRLVLTDKGYVADVVSATADDSFERHYWRYPFVGRLPYKGFYRRADAEREAARLKRRSMDVIIRPVDAFSALGIVEDPLFSFMLAYAPDQIAELIIHESVHATLFIRGEDQFNEELATFIGRLGAERYLAERFGIESEPAKARERRREDAERFRVFLAATGAELERAYAEAGQDRAARLEAKARIIRERAELYAEKEAERFRDPGYADFDMAKINNAFIDLYRLYEEDLSLYARFLEGPADSSPRRMLELLVALARERRGKAMKELLADAADAGPARLDRGYGGG